MSDMEDHLRVSLDVTEEKRRALLQVVPEAFSEGRLDIEALQRALGVEMFSESERYALTWAGKNDAYKVLQISSSATIRPQRELSVNFDEAQHVFIEGENLEVLKILQKAYFGKVKLIYIDPPYNTGSDAFIYPDRFQETKEDYLRRINDLSDDGTLMREGFFQKNNRENGHFHSNWLSMMLPRLYIARNLLRDDGMIFVSCDDNEVHNLRCLMNEVFGEENFISQLIIQSNKRGQTYKDIAKTHEYLVAYGRSENATLYELPKDDDALPYEDARGKFDLWELRNRNPEFGKHNRPNLYFPIYVSPEETDSVGYSKISLEPSESFTVEVFPKNSAGKESCWRWSREKITSNDITSEFAVVVGRKKRNGEWNIYEKSRKGTTKPKSIWDETEVINEQGTIELGELGLGGIFDHPKPRGLISKILKIATEADDLIFDFFAGSSTTADAVLRLNDDDKMERRFVLVQLPEPIDPTSDAAAAGFKTIADVSRERIRRVLAKLKPEDADHSQPQNGPGFKSFVLAPSNFRQWRGDGIETPEQLEAQIRLFINSEKEGADTESILFELLLKFGQELTTRYETLQISGTRVFWIPDLNMFFVFEAFTEDMIAPLLSRRPREIVVLDSVFQGSDELKSNLDLHCRDAAMKLTCI
ncbi:MAG TPA: site-specific DNA-methyltransferase [Pyrinomonadaceae bacterium]|nr:site-specific DNA-methyltransferase [Pyrinomonadaceae bacterium]